MEGSSRSNDARCVVAEDLKNYCVVWEDKVNNK